MLIVNERKSLITPELIERYRAIEPATLGHLLETGFVDPAVRPLFPPGVVAGPAFTVRTAPQDSTIVHLAIDQAQPGDVLVIDRSGDRTHACWGGMTTLAAKLNKLAAVIIDGPATDLTEIEETGLVVYSRGLSAMTTKGICRDGEINTPVSIGGVGVNPGDLVLADANGILILTPQMALEMIVEAEAVQARGGEMRAMLMSGVKISEARGAAGRVAAAIAARK